MVIKSRSLCIWPSVSLVNAWVEVLDDASPTLGAFDNATTGLCSYEPISQLGPVDVIIQCSQQKAVFNPPISELVIVDNSIAELDNYEASLPTKQVQPLNNALAGPDVFNNASLALSVFDNDIVRLDAVDNATHGVDVLNNAISGLEVFDKAIAGLGYHKATLQPGLVYWTFHGPQEIFNQPPGLALVKRWH